MFRVGQLVVCVDDECSGKFTPWPASDQDGLGGLKRGNVYTIARVGTYRAADCVWLCEIQRPADIWRPHDGEPGFSPRRFRPVQDNRIAIFRQLLVNPPREVVDA